MEWRLQSNRLCSTRENAWAVAYAVAQAVVLVVVDEVVVNVVPVAGPQGDGGAAPSAEFAVVHPQAGVFRGDAVGDGELVVVLVPPALGEGPSVVLQAGFGVGAPDAQAGDAGVRAHHADQGPGLEGVAEDHPAPRTPATPAGGQGHALGDFQHEFFDVDPLGAVDFRVSVDVDQVPPPGVLQGVEQGVERGDPFFRRGQNLRVAFPASGGAAFVRPRPAQLAVDLHPGLA